MSDGWGITGWDDVLTSFPHTTRRVLPGLDAQSFTQLLTLSESDGGDNAKAGEIYGIDLVGPNIEGTKTVQQEYVASTADQLTEIIDDLDPLIKRSSRR